MRDNWLDFKWLAWSMLLDYADWMSNIRVIVPHVNNRQAPRDYRPLRIFSGVVVCIADALFGKH